MSTPPASACRFRSRLGRVAAGVCAAALMASPSPQAAAAEDPLAPLALFGAATGPAEQGLVDLILPYGPYIFDLVVWLSRNVVAITYDSRAYDPVTRDFVVIGLKAGRNEIDVAVDRIRLGASRALYEGIAIDTRNIPMEPATREALKTLRSEIIRGDIVTSVVADPASATYDIDIKADFDSIGALALAAKVEGFHVLIPLDEVAAEFETPPADGLPTTSSAASDAPVLVGKLVRASLSYDDAGLTPAGFAIVAEAQDIATEELRGTVAIMLTPMITSLFKELPGGASPELQTRAAGWSAAMNAYVANPDHIEITFSPEEPFDLSQIKPGAAFDEAMILALNPDVTTAATAATALIDPGADAATGDDDMSLAERLVEGVGLPQDVERGVALALADVAAGKAEAADIVVRAIALDPDAAVTGDNASSSYTLLLVAKARGVAVPESAMTAVRGRLQVTQLALAERAALDQWRGTDEGASEEGRERAAIEARDWSAMRNIAFDFYEGETVPRNLTRAFTFAQLAAAGGDRIAASLRNDLLAGLREKRLGFDVAAGREEASAIWRTIVAGSNDAEPEEDAPAGGDGSAPPPSDDDQPARPGAL